MAESKGEYRTAQEGKVIEREAFILDVEAVMATLFCIMMLEEEQRENDLNEEDSKKLCEYRDNIAELVTEYYTYTIPGAGRRGTSLAWEGSPRAG